MSTTAIPDKPIVFPDRDRDKSYIGQFAEVISQVQMKTSDGSTVTIDLENIGQIEVKPWSSDDQPSQGEAPMFGTAEDRTVFSPVNGHDLMILELMAEHARKFHAVAHAADAESTGQGRLPIRAAEKTVKVAG